ncbi:MAG: hypothetical protein RTU09_09690 [Candidatus Thorarchaeota archaeon]
MIAQVSEPPSTPYIGIFPVTIAILGWTLLCGFLYIPIRIGLSDARQSRLLTICFLVFVIWLIPAGFLLCWLMAVSQVTIGTLVNPLTAILFLQLVAMVWDIIRQLRRVRA